MWLKLENISPCRISLDCFLKLNLDCSKLIFKPLTALAVTRTTRDISFYRFYLLGNKSELRICQ